MFNTEKIYTDNQRRKKDLITEELISSRLSEFNRAGRVIVQDNVIVVDFNKKEMFS